MVESGPEAGYSEPAAPAPATTNTPAPAVQLSGSPPGVAFNEVETPEALVSLERWCLTNGFSTPRRVTFEPQPTYAFASSNGTMEIKIGSEMASWNGLEYRLGFRPQLIGGHPFVHSLDARKNFAALAQNPVTPGARHVIVIDPGHGGSDVGASNVYNGHFEKEFVLDLARRLQGLLRDRSWTALLTRSNDVFVPLVDRVAFAEQHQADLFISLHFNSAFPDRQQAGLETYCLTPAGMSSSLTRGYGDDASLIYPNNRFDEANLQLAVELHRAILAVNGHVDRGVRRARFLTVLQGQNRPAVLVEGGYLSNPQEARQIADPAYRQRLAEALARGLLGDDWLKPSLASHSSAGLSSTNSTGKIN